MNIHAIMPKDRDLESDNSMARIQSIITVTQGGVLYRDIADIVQWIDFKLCNENSGQGAVSASLSAQQRNHCVGQSSFDRASLAYIEFFTEPITRLEFENKEDLWDLLKQMRLRGGWFAINID